MYECLVQRDRSIIISLKVSSRHDLILDCVKPSYIDTLNQMSVSGPRINPHMTMFHDTFKYVVLILLYFHVAFKVQQHTFTRGMRGNKEPFGLTCHVVYIIWSQEMVSQVRVGLH